MEIIITRPETKKLFYRWTSTSPAPAQIFVRLAASDSGVEIRGVFEGSHTSILPISISVTHEAPDTKSRITLRGIVQDHASVDIKVTATLAKGARGANTAIDGRALLLSDDARAELRPYLEIDENEVKATHTTFVGPLDEEELFYARSRGLTENEARSLLITGFLAPVTTPT